MVREGYKQTEVGVIPEDWECIEAGTIIKFFGGNGFSSRSETKNGIRWLKIANVGVEQVKWDEVTFLPKDFAVDFKDYLLQPNDVVMALTRPILGDKLKVARLGAKDSPALLNQRVAKLIPLGNTQFSYIYYLVQRLDFVTAMNIAMAGTDPPNIGNTALAKILVPIPSSSEEQYAIATALSDVDALIAALDKLLAKHRHLKTATMQQLLTGKKRLPGFGEGKGYKQTGVGVIPEDWILTALEKVSAFITKGSTPTTYGFSWTQDGILFLRSECVSENGLDLSQSMFISEKAHSALSRSELRAGDLLITITGNVGRIVYLDEDFGVANMNQHIARIRIIDNGVCSKFVYHYLNQSTMRKAFNTITTGQAYPQISLKQVRDSLVPMPSVEEQRAIATVLSDMDAAISALETRRAKTQAIKQGMMQELLTGRTRLV